MVIININIFQGEEEKDIAPVTGTVGLDPVSDGLAAVQDVLVGKRSVAARNLPDIVL